MPFYKKKPVVPKKPVPEKEAIAVVGGGAPVTAESEGGSSNNPELLRGFRDIMPEEQGKWNLVRDSIRRLADAYSFDRIDMPILERADLFLRTLGKGTDVVEKEMYVFTDPSNRSVALRPEATASAARAYINHGMLDRPQPVKFWYLGPIFRDDRHHAGRPERHRDVRRARERCDGRHHEAATVRPDLLRRPVRCSWQVTPASRSTTTLPTAISPIPSTPGG